MDDDNSQATQITDWKTDQITDWKTVFVKCHPEATNHIVQQQLQYWKERNAQTLQALQNFSNTHNIDGMAVEAKHAMEHMVESLWNNFDPNKICKGPKDTYWRRLCDLPFSSDDINDYSYSCIEMLDTVNADGKVKCLFCDEMVQASKVFTNWERDTAGKDG